MRFFALWNPFVFVGYDIASKQQIKETVRELYSSKPHLTATIGFSFAGLSAALSGAVWTGAVATLIVLACMMFRVWMEHHFRARSSEDVGEKWVRLFVFGSLLSTPILNMPQSAILGLHKIEERPVAVDGQVAIRPMMYLAVSYDHRLIDGREAVTFLVKVKEAIEAPEKLLLGL